MQSEVSGTRPSLWLLAVLTVLLGFASISTDFYLPALPEMATALGGDASAMEFTISGYLVGFSLGQLLWGPIGDRIGRRTPIALGLVLFVIGSAGCALSTSAPEIICWRLVQAFGASAGVVLARAMVRDLYAGARGAQVLSTLLMVMAIAPLIGPIAGGQILLVGTWRTIFWLLVAIGLVTLCALWTIPETLAVERRQTEPLSRAVTQYFPLFQNRAFLGYAAAGGFFYGGIFAYVAGSPFAYITYYEVTPQLYGLIFSTCIIGIMASNFINARIVTRFGYLRILRAGTLGAVLAGAALLLCVETGWGGIIGLAISLHLFISMAGFIVANSVTGALSAFPHRAGAASALVGALQYGTGILGSALVGTFANGTLWPLCLVTAAAALGAFACAWRLIPQVRT